MCCTGACPYEVRIGYNDTDCRLPRGEQCWLEREEPEEEEEDSEE